MSPSAELRVRLAAGRYVMRPLRGDSTGFGREFDLVNGGEAEVDLREAVGEMLEVTLSPLIDAADVLLVPGDVPAPASAAQWRWLGELAMHAKVARGVALLPAVPPGRYTLFINRHIGFHRLSIQQGNVAAKLEVKLPAQLAPIPSD